jgi:hypothetical protein
MSALPPIAGIRQRDGHVRYVPLADIERERRGAVPLLGFPNKAATSPWLKPLFHDGSTPSDKVQLKEVFLSGIPALC